jgi:hypothetical protein
LSTTRNFNSSHNNNEIWVIAAGRSSDIDLSAVIDEKVVGPYKEYRLSDIGRYLLNPNSIEVKKKLIGGEVHHKQGTIKRIRKTIHKIQPFFLRKRKQIPSLSPEMIVSRFKMRRPVVKDPELEAHLNKIYVHLKSYDSFARKLDRLDPQKIYQIVGICEDVGGNYSYLKLQGSIEEKIKYLGNSIAKDVGVILNKAYVAEGLYELRGYDFQSYNPAAFYRLYSYNNGKESKACVLTSQDQVEFYITDNQLLKHIFLLEQSLKANPSLYEAFEKCAGGEATAIKLFFNKKLEIDYAKSPLPAIYQDVLKSHDTQSNHQNMIKPILNYLQIGISLNYMLASDDNDDRMITHISVLHDFRALEPLRKNLPDVYAAVAKQGFITDSGRYYLLDSINGYDNA